MMRAAFPSQHPIPLEKDFARFIRLAVTVVEAQGFKNIKYCFHLFYTVYTTPKAGRQRHHSTSQCRGFSMEEQAGARAIL